jgi:hypothetical protein
MGKDHRLLARPGDVPPEGDAVMGWVKVTGGLAVLFGVGAAAIDGGLWVSAHLALVIAVVSALAVLLAVLAVLVRRHGSRIAVRQWEKPRKQKRVPRQLPDVEAAFWEPERVITSRAAEPGPAGAPRPPLEQNTDRLT